MREGGKVRKDASNLFQAKDVLCLCVGMCVCLCVFFCARACGYDCKHAVFALHILHVRTCI